MLPLRSVSKTVLVCLTVAVAGAASGQNYPSKVVRIITGSAGGGTDFTSRQIAQGVSGTWGQPVIVDNRGGTLALDVGAKSPPDGYTLNVASSGMWTTPLLQKVPYAVSDFAPISLLIREPYIVGVHPSLPVKSIKEFIALAKAKPGELNYASGSYAGSGHIGGALFAYMAGINMVHVPFKGTLSAVTGLVSGEAQMFINDAGTMMPLIKAGKIRALAVATPEPSALLPGLPTVTASGVPGYENSGVSVFLAPAKTPVAIVTRLHQDVCRVFNTTEVRQKFLDANQEVVCSTPEAFAAYIKSDTAKITNLIKVVGIKVD